MKKKNKIYLFTIIIFLISFFFIYKILIQSDFYIISTNAITKDNVLIISNKRMNKFQKIVFQKKNETYIKLYNPLTNNFIWKKKLPFEYKFYTSSKGILISDNNLYINTGLEHDILYCYNLSNANLNWKTSFNRKFQKANNYKMEFEILSKDYLLITKPIDELGQLNDIFIINRKNGKIVKKINKIKIIHKIDIYKIENNIILKNIRNYDDYYLLNLKNLELNFLCNDKSRFYIIENSLFKFDIKTSSIYKIKEINKNSLSWEFIIKLSNNISLIGLNKFENNYYGIIQNKYLDNLEKTIIKIENTSKKWEITGKLKLFEGILDSEFDFNINLSKYLPISYHSYNSEKENLIYQYSNFTIIDLKKMEIIENYQFNRNKYLYDIYKIKENYYLFSSYNNFLIRFNAKNGKNINGVKFKDTKFDSKYLQYKISLYSDFINYENILFIIINKKYNLFVKPKFATIDLNNLKIKNNNIKNFGIDDITNDIINKKN